jgi:hypothetical protein
LRLTLFAVAAATLDAQHPLPQFVDITSQAGISFRHVNGASASKYLVETMGSGGLFFDYDNDGWIDIFLVDGGSHADPVVARRARHRLYHNRGNLTFEDTTGRSGIQHREYGMGACAGDVDGDGWIDLYITNDGPNTLYRNRGDGTFVDTTAAAGVGDSRWSVSCAFADLDGDGDLDLFVVNYVSADYRTNPFCGDGKTNARFYCHPLQYRPLPNTLYRNDGRGAFTDVGMESGIGATSSNGLGVAIVDYNDDGRPDVFVANDSLPNALLRNDGNLRFTDLGPASGIAFAPDGKARAGMGIDTGDYDGDGRLDVVITNFDREMHSLHRGIDRGLFSYTSTEAGIGFQTLPFLGFGVAFLDFDNDARLDIAIANGHIQDNAPQLLSGSTYRQRKLLFRNTNMRRFAEVSREVGTAFAAERVGRGLATGDIDNDGDLDWLVTNNGEAPDLLRNDSGTAGHSIVVRLQAAGGNRDGIGARLRLQTGARTQLRDVKSGTSYLSQSDLRAHFGLGETAVADRIDVVWPSGRMETVSDVKGDQLVTIAEGKGIVARNPFTR